MTIYILSIASFFGSLLIYAGITLLSLIALLFVIVNVKASRMKKARRTYASFRFKHLFGRWFILEIRDLGTEVDVQLHMWMKIKGS